MDGQVAMLSVDEPLQGALGGRDFGVERRLLSSEGLAVLGEDVARSIYRGGDDPAIAG